ncbi:MAG: SLC26A/SulP transporter family protein [Anaerolineae bacterium]|nr:SLC26A/SulP transporter family protein [Anaerolineae bacterium]
MARITRSGLVLGLREACLPKRLVPCLTTGVLMGVTEAIFALSVGSLIFSGDLAPYLPYGIGMALVTSTLMLVGISLGSSAPGVTGILQDSPSVILAVMASALISALPAARVADRLATVLVAIACTTLLTGLFFLVLGFLKLGGLVRFLPYPVIGGFLAGTGWLLVRGSFGVMTGVPLTLAHLATLLQPAALTLWVPGVLFALVLFLGLRRIRHFLTMPAILVVTFILFYLALLLTGTSVSDATNQGLLLGAVSGQAAWRPPLAMDLRAVDWGAILGQGGNLTVVLVLSVVGLLLNASALELAFRRDLDLNRELRVAGVVNIVSGLSGGAVGYHVLDLSTLCVRTGARGRLPGLVAGALCVAVLFAGAPLLAFFPRPVLGGLLFFLGLGFLVEWVIDGRSKLPRADYAVVLLILLVIGAAGFLAGVAVGLAAAIALFVLNYSRTSVVRCALSGAEIRSNVERVAYHRRVLNELGPHIYILKLQGFLFFGTANALLEQIRARVADPSEPQLLYILLDFRRVTGLDSSAVISFVKGRQLAESQGITLLLANLPDKARSQFERGGLVEGEGVRFVPDLDHGLEWCENQLLDDRHVTHVHLPLTLSAQLVDGGLEREQAHRLLPFLEKVQLEAGEYLLRQDDEADSLYFIEQGGVTV